jgi:hypothetical protein
MPIHLELLTAAVCKIWTCANCMDLDCMYLYVHSEINHGKPLIGVLKVTCASLGHSNPYTFR